MYRENNPGLKEKIVCFRSPDRPYFEAPTLNFFWPPRSVFYRSIYFYSLMTISGHQNASLIDYRILRSRFFRVLYSSFNGEPELGESRIRPSGGDREMRPPRGT